MTEITAQSIDEALRKQLDALNTSVESREVGSVVQIGDGIARIDGLKGAMQGELLEFTGEGGKIVYGLAQNLEEEEVGAVLLGDITAIKENDQCRTTGRILEVPSGKGMIGRVVNALGEPIDGKGPIEAEGYRPIEFKAPGVHERQPVHEPMQTGIIPIDAMVPIGRGQRELIIGDRQTGKTSIAIDTILNQKGQNMICVYVAIGQKASTVSTVVESSNVAALWTTPSLLQQRHLILLLCSILLLWLVQQLVNTSCTPAKTESLQAQTIQDATYCASMTTCLSRQLLIDRCH